jgi:hypothetical protein
VHWLTKTKQNRSYRGETNQYKSKLEKGTNVEKEKTTSKQPVSSTVKINNSPVQHWK